METKWKNTGSFLHGRRILGWILKIIVDIMGWIVLAQDRDLWRILVKELIFP